MLLKDLDEPVQEQRFIPWVAEVKLAKLQRDRLAI